MEVTEIEQEHRNEQLGLSNEQNSSNSQFPNTQSSDQPSVISIPEHHNMETSAQEDEDPESQSSDQPSVINTPAHQHINTSTQEDEDSNSQFSILPPKARLALSGGNSSPESEAHQEQQSPLSSIANALKSDLKAQVEAVLFVSDTPLKAGAIAKMLNASYDDVQSSLVQLIQEYEDRSGGLEIGTDDGYIIQVKMQYLNIVTDMMPLELNPGPMRTLSAVALKEPVLQSEVIDMRGSGAYEHINELVEQDLITKKPKGLSFILATTTKFQQYFRLTQDANKIREKLQENAVKRAKEKEMKNAALQNETLPAT